MTDSAIVLLCLAIVVGSLALARRTSYLRLGYRVSRLNRDQWVYEELYERQQRRLVFDGEMLSGAPHTIWVPDPTSWDQQMPEWAHGRRAEILLRVKKLTGNAASLVETKAASRSS